MNIKFKTTALKKQWENLLLVNPKLCNIVAIYMTTIKKDITITSIYRTEDKGVHGLWRGVDISVIGFDLKKVAEVLKGLNAQIIYDKARPKLVTYLLHDIGKGNHIHVQNIL